MVLEWFSDQIPKAFKLCSASWTTYAFNVSLAIARSGVDFGATIFGAFIPRGTVGPEVKSDGRQLSESLGTLLTLESALAVPLPLFVLPYALPPLVATSAAIHVCRSRGMCQQ